MTHHLPDRGAPRASYRACGIIGLTEGGTVAGDQGRAHEVAFVLGGGGVLGAHEVGMLQALVEAGIRPDLVVGTSVGAINGAMVAADPTAATIRRLHELWTGIGDTDVFGSSLAAQVGTLIRTRTHLHSNTALRRLLH